MSQSVSGTILGQRDTQAVCVGGDKGAGSCPVTLVRSLAEGLDVAPGEEPDAAVDLPLPPVGVGAVQDLDDVPTQEGQLGALLG